MNPKSCQECFDQIMDFAAKGFPGADGEWLESWDDDCRKIIVLVADRLDVIDG